jgi:hypothetical protein
VRFHSSFISRLIIEITNDTKHVDAAYMPTLGSGLRLVVVDCDCCLEVSAAMNISPDPAFRNPYEEPFDLAARSKPNIELALEQMAPLYDELSLRPA